MSGRIGDGGAWSVRTLGWALLIASCAPRVRDVQTTPGAANEPRAVPAPTASGVRELQVGKGEVCRLTVEGVVECSTDCRQWHKVRDGVRTFAMDGERGCSVGTANGCWSRSDWWGSDRAWRLDVGLRIEALRLGLVDVCAGDGVGRYECFRFDGEAVVPWDEWSREEAKPPAPPPFDDLSDVATSGLYACLARRDGSVWCAGNNGLGTLGVRIPSRVSLDYVRVPGIPPTQQLATTMNFACSLARSGAVHCWGVGAWIASTGLAVLPPTAVHGLEDTLQLTAARTDVCALSRTGRITCFGQKWGGRRTLVLESDTERISAGGSDLCALDARGGVTCWSAEGSTICSASTAPPANSSSGP